MKKFILATLLALALGMITGILFWPSTAAKVVPTTTALTPAAIPLPLHVKVRQYLADKKSPLASEAPFLIQLQNWKLIIAIGNAEGQICQHQIDFNCWGLGGDENFRHYSSYKASLQDINDYIASWQAKGRWQTPEQMNCSYVVPCSNGWLRTVNTTLEELKSF